ncbi:type B 50S ribosomal protein L31 [Marinobacterium marinum]|uniref:Large ribosomal subunit protein bL31B n=1 Tax=Marinobacterium marinum TaxID=2756129 RepID=A0A7W1WX06_9GAMM|nr:type B 50S ribosomal protein L31 [Marinobacterium marinum]MBA4501751.1 type B 50S ribosomal protein L31 [Marinobacterium marinum]
MKDGIHPESNYVIFRDTSCGKTFRIRSTCKPTETIVWDDGETYPLVNLDISSASHPIYTGEQRKASNEGRVARFNKRFGKRGQKISQEN